MKLQNKKIILDNQREKLIELLKEKDYAISGNLRDSFKYLLIDSSSAVRFFMNETIFDTIPYELVAEKKLIELLESENPYDLTNDVWYTAGEDFDYLFYLYKGSITKGYGFFQGSFCEDWNVNEKECWKDLVVRKLTLMEVEEYVTKKFKELIEIKYQTNCWKNAKIESCLVHGSSRLIDSYVPMLSLFQYSNRIWVNDGCIFKDGKFAEPIFQNVTTENI